MGLSLRKSELEKWETLLDSGDVTHVRPRKWCGKWALLAYNRTKPIPFLGSIEDSPEAYAAVVSRNISIEDILL